MSREEPLLGQKKQQLQQQFLTELLGQDLNGTKVYRCLLKNHLKLLQLYHL